MNFLTRAVILTALIVCACAIRDEQVAYKRTPFMRLAEQFEGSESAENAVLQATELSEESSESAVGVPNLPTELTEESTGMVQESTSLPSIPSENTQAPPPSTGGESGLSEQARSELDRISAAAEASARKTLARAAAKAKAILDAARRGSTKASPCDSGCSDGPAQKSNNQDYMILQIPPAEVALDDRKLGLAPPMSVDTPLLKQAEKVGEFADISHEKFLDKHEADCAGPICPLAK
jgi:hypothetical protein